MRIHGTREAVESLVVEALCAVEAVVALRSRSGLCHLYLLNPFIFLKAFSSYDSWTKSLACDSDSVIAFSTVNHFFNARRVNLIVELNTVYCQTFKMKSDFIT